MIKEQRNDLTEGPILKGLVMMALPIMATSFIQMAYNLTDMFWIGFLGSGAVAAVGIAGFFIWLSQAFVFLGKTGTEIKVAQATGAGDHTKAESIARTGIQITMGIAVLYSMAIMLFRHPLIQFFDTRNDSVESMSLSYLAIIAAGLVFPFGNQVFTGIFNGRGNSKMPFKINAIGLIINMILDPILINGAYVFPKMGVSGAAVATVIAQAVVFSIFFYNIRFKHSLFKHFLLFKRPDVNQAISIMRLGFPPALQSALFTMISMVIARIIASYGALPIAVQKVGSQIESITWMTALGFSVALGTFVGQNYGASKFSRVLKGYHTAMRVAFSLGLFNTLLLFFGAKWLFMIFIREPEAIQLGIDYLRILALSQLFMCVEITSSSAFNGIGRTEPAAITSIVFNLLRIPMALYFSQMTMLGLNGIWWSITISSVFKGVIVYIWFGRIIKKRPEFHEFEVAHVISNS
ncbi:MAG TPA: MATE family efflux transporter [Clostridiales bacterium UBA8960]|nr:MATE family efflux transporter [Clostridiales bacterium UBA8960]